MVIDFSTWEPDDILAYLRKRKEEEVCGRFNATQVAQPLPSQEDLLDRVVRAHMPLLRKIAAVIVLSFGLLYAGDAVAQQHPLGKVAAPHTEQQAPQQQQIMGKPAYGYNHNNSPVTDTVKVADTTYQPQIMGMIAMPPKEVHIDKKPVKGKGTVKKKTK